MLRQKLFSSQSYFFGAASHIFFSLIGKVLGFFSQILAIALLGATRETDIVLFVFGFLALFSMFFTRYSGDVLLPRIVRSQQAGEDKVESEIGLLILILLAFCSLFQIFALEITAFLGNFSKSDLQELIPGLRCLLLLPIGVFLGDLFLQVLQSRKNFLFSSSVSILQGISILVLVPLFHETLGSNSLAVALSLAPWLQTLILFLVLRKDLPFSLHPAKLFRLNRASLSWISLSFLLQLNHFLQVFLPERSAAQFAGGDLTTVLLAKKVFEILPHLLVFPIVHVAFPRICARLEDGNWKTIREYLQSLFRVTIVLSLPAASFLFLFSEEITRLLFLHGKIQSSQVMSLKQALCLFIPSFLGLIFVSVGSKTIFASSNTKVIRNYAFFQFVLSLLLIPLLAWFCKVFGLMGVPLSITIFHCIQIPAHLFALNWLGISLEGHRDWLFCVAILSLTGILTVSDLNWISLLGFWASALLLCFYLFYFLKEKHLKNSLNVLKKS